VVQKKPTLSAIIPVSDVTRNWETLRAILESAQGYEIEILLCIDSSDFYGLKQLASDFLSQNPDLFKILVGDFPNQGVARNMGISKATADWICFWDCDDIPIISSVLQQLEKLDLNNSKFDLLVGGIEVITEPLIVSTFAPTASGSSEFYKDLGFMPAFTRFVYRRESIINTRFANLSFGEDIFFLSNLFTSNLQIYSSQEIFYKYLRGHPRSVTSSYKNFASPEYILWRLLQNLTRTKGKDLSNFQAILLARQYLAITKNYRDINWTKFILIQGIFILAILRKPTKVLCGIRYILKRKHRDYLEIAPIVEVFLFGGLGNQLFQLAAGLFVSTGSRLKLNTISKSLRRSEKGLVGLQDFVLPPSIFFEQSEGLRPKRVSQGLLSLALVLSSKGSVGVLGKISFTLVLLFTRLSSFKGAQKFLSNGVGFDQRLRSVSNNSRLIGCFHTYRWADSVHVKEQLATLKLIKPPDWMSELIHLSKEERPNVVHIRRGDYDGIPELGFLNIDYFEEAMRRNLELNPKGKFWIFSDDFEFVRRELPHDLILLSRFIDNDPLNAGAHLELMRHGHTYVLSNSTFSWWGAFLSHQSNPSVICPRDWFATKSNPIDLLPESWTKLPNGSSK
jgi:glycosyltransferase involved in cell wall biosynthesis